MVKVILLAPPASDRRRQCWRAWVQQCTRGGSSPSPQAGTGLPTPGGLSVHSRDRHPLKSKHLKRPRGTARKPNLVLPGTCPCLPCTSFLLPCWGSGRCPSSPRGGGHVSMLASSSPTGLQLSSHMLRWDSLPQSVPNHRTSRPQKPGTPTLFLVALLPPSPPSSWPLSLDMPFAGAFPQVGDPGPNIIPGRCQVSWAQDGSTHTWDTLRGPISSLGLGAGCAKSRAACPISVTSTVHTSASVSLTVKWLVAARGRPSAAAEHAGRGWSLPEPAALPPGLTCPPGRG